MLSLCRSRPIEQGLNVFRPYEIETRDLILSTDSECNDYMVSLANKQPVIIHETWIKISNIILTFT